MKKSFHVSSSSLLLAAKSTDSGADTRFTPDLATTISEKRKSLRLSHVMSLLSWIPSLARYTSSVLSCLSHIVLASLHHGVCQPIVSIFTVCRRTLGTADASRPGAWGTSRSPPRRGRQCAARCSTWSVTFTHTSLGKGSELRPKPVAPSQLAHTSSSTS